MSDTVYRYPGAQPFRDNDFSRRTFFGRESASVALADQVLANRLVIVYAKSGLGKTSLLNAGVAPRIREAGSIPLFVRVNDIDRGPLASVLEGISAEAERQQVEYVAGDTSSLWSFFKTVEFWRGDLLLAPVLILDQFEELFTLQPEDKREAFLSDLGFVVRGVPPPSLPKTDSASDAPPPLRIVLSLREDFLGLLEEASDRIPQIMDHRFRLAPLTCEMAAEAITRPAAIEDPALATKPFRLDPGFVNWVLDYLSKSASGAHGSPSRGSRYIEPFHLQLICQRIEKFVAFKQQTSTPDITFSLKDFGGETVMAQTLTSFYTDAIRSLPGRHLRGAARRLCEEYLISPEGRRLSMDERELQRQLKLPYDVLTQLVERRLLRTDRRSDSTYYELSHDALVQPVLAPRRVQALAIAWGAIIAGAMTCLVGAVFVVACIAVLAEESQKNANDYITFLIGMTVMLGASAGIGIMGIRWLRSGIRRRRRYRRHTPSEIARQLPTLQPFKDRLLGWTMLAFGTGLLIYWGLKGLLLPVVFGSLSFTRGRFPKWLEWVKGHDLLASWQLMHAHPFVEVPWKVIELSTIVVFSWMLLRQGGRTLWPHRFAPRSEASAIAGFDASASLLGATRSLFLGSAALLMSGLVFFALRGCSSIAIWHGFAVRWLPRPMIGSNLPSACGTLIKTGWDMGWISAGLFCLSSLVFSVVLLRRGIRDVRNEFRRQLLARLQHEPGFRGEPPVADEAGKRLLDWFESERLFLPNAPAWARKAAVVCGALLLAVLLYWTWPRSTPEYTTPWPVWAVGAKGAILHTEDEGASWKTQTSGTEAPLSEVAFATPLSGWVVGHQGVILHTEDGGEKWKPQTSPTTADLSSITFPTEHSGWAVGRKGTILHTNDGGETWEPQTSGTAADLYVVAFPTPLSGWVAGGKGTILHTKDAGATWQSETCGVKTDLNAVVFATPQLGWAVGDAGIILNTQDGGVTWKPQTSGNTRNLFFVTFATNSSVWAVGAGGTILHTDDGGTTWQEQASETADGLVEAAFATPESGWVVGEKGVILHTDNGGLTWKLQTSGVDVSLQSVASRQRGFIGVRLSAQKQSASGGDAATTVTVDSVARNGPADRAGVRAGDTILSVNGQPVKTNADVVSEIIALKPGTEATLNCIRSGKGMTVRVTISDHPAPFPSPSGH